MEQLQCTTSQTDYILACHLCQLHLIRGQNIARALSSAVDAHAIHLPCGLQLGGIFDCSTGYKKPPSSHPHQSQHTSNCISSTDLAILASLT